MSCFGCGVVVPGTGVLLNNGMCWFDPEPGRPQLDRPQSPAAHQPDADDRSRRGGGARLAVGASGGRRILDAVAQIIVNHVDHGLGPQAAITSPRVDASEPRILIDDRVGAETIAALAALGHDIAGVPTDFHFNPFASPTAIHARPRRRPAARRDRPVLSGHRRRRVSSALGAECWTLAHVRIERPPDQPVMLQSR